MRLAILILTHKRARLLENCLKSVVEQESHQFELDFHVLINGQDQETQGLLEAMEVPFDSVKDSLPVGEARNLLIEKVKAPYICFLDDDITLPRGYFNKAQEIIESHPQVDMFGGPDQTPEDSSDFQKCLGLVMASYLATGPTNKRHKRDLNQSETGNEINLILCNFWAKSEVFKIRGFPAAFRRNEENYLLSILEDMGIKMLRDPQLYVFHQRKTSLAKLIRVLFLAGTFRTVSICFYPGSARPLFFLHQAGLIFLIIALVYWPKIAGITLGSYFAIISIESMRIAAASGRVADYPRAVALFVIFNFVYPVGQFYGYLKAALFKIKGQKF